MYMFSCTFGQSQWPLRCYLSLTNSKQTINKTEATHYQQTYILTFQVFPYSCKFGWFFVRFYVGKACKPQNNGMVIQHVKDPSCCVWENFIKLNTVLLMLKTYFHSFCIFLKETICNVLVRTESPTYTDMDFMLTPCNQMFHCPTFILCTSRKESALWSKQKVEIKGCNFDLVLDVLRAATYTTWYITPYYRSCLNECIPFYCC